jgi:hypothetical protein
MSTVAVDEQAVPGDFQEPRHAVGVEILGQALPALGRRDRLHRVTADMLLAQEVAEERAGCGKPPLDAARRESATKTGRGEVANVFAVQA